MIEKVTLAQNQGLIAKNSTAAQENNRSFQISADHYGPKSHILWNQYLNLNKIRKRQKKHA